MWFAYLHEYLKSRSLRTPPGWTRGPRRSAAQPAHRHRQPEVECLEDLTLLSVQFTPGPYLTPASRPNVPLGVIRGIYAGMKIPSEINVKFDLPGLSNSGGAAFMYLWEPGTPR